MHLIIVDSQKRTQEALSSGLRRAGHAVSPCSDVQQITATAEDHGANALIAATASPAAALAVTRNLRAAGFRLPLLILEPERSAEARAGILNAGADDCLSSPFAFEELLARVEALCRRTPSRDSANRAACCLTVDRSRHAAVRNGRSIRLTPLELSLLEFLIPREGDVVTRAEIEAHLYGINTRIASNAVDRVVGTLRRKIQPPGSTPLLQTRHGVGFLLQARG